MLLLFALVDECLRRLHGAWQDWWAELDALARTPQLVVALQLEVRLDELLLAPTVQLCRSGGQFGQQVGKNLRQLAGHYIEMAGELATMAAGKGRRVARARAGGRHGR